MSEYAGVRVVVVGAGVAGAASARVLLDLGASVTVLDRRDSPALAGLAAAGARAMAVAMGLDVYSEPELAWRLRGPDAPAWLAVTGTNGKTTATTMLAAMLAAAGLRTAALGNIGVPLVDATTGYDALAVELSSQQLHWSRTLAPRAGAILNLADDHLDWHGGFPSYVDAKVAIWRSAATGGTAVGNLDDPLVAARLSTVDGDRVGFTLGEPKPGEFGLVDGVLVDSTGLALAPADTVRPAGTHNVANALAAAALARSHGVPPEAVRAGLAGYVPQPHRNAFVTTVGGVSYVDDSKATNPHAAYASLTAYPRIVWIAGGQLKGVDVDDLVAGVAGRLAGAVLLGVDRARVAEALARHAPQVPVVEVANVDDGAMAEVVRAAARLARPGDTVLLAPAAASYDMFANYGARGDAFAAAARAL
jgi:UDP-N-acetylmuramoylalanine--D-glutamate ligase